MKSEESKIPVENGYQIWYRRIGSGGIPLLTLHGGPGAGHDYLEPLEGLATDRTVIFYDQLGCGKSDQPDDRSMWRIERFVTEIDILRKTLGLEKVHLFGQSWGGWLAIEYMLTRPTGIASLTLASTSASVPQFVAEASRLKSELPKNVRDVMKRYEEAKDFHNPEYESATMVFYQNYLCRLPKWPDCIMRSIENLNGNAVYETMNGPNEFMVIGNLKNWDRTERLGEIVVPTLITVGRYDELTPACAESLYQGIPGSNMVIFEDSAHEAHIEETDKYLKVVSEFMRDAENRETSKAET